MIAIDGQLSKHITALARFHVLL